MVEEILDVRSTFVPCKYDKSCSRYDCFYKHTTDSGLCPEAEKLLKKQKKEIKVYKPK